MMVRDSSVVVFATTVRTSFLKNTAVFSCTGTRFLTHFETSLDLMTYADLTAQDQLG